MEYTTNAPVGARLLNLRLPGWRKLVNRETFSIESYRDCILAQIFGTYDRGKTAIYGDQYLIPHEDGFTSFRLNECETARLQLEWLHIIQEGL
jgi:hypothetical protein